MFRKVIFATCLILGLALSAHAQGQLVSNIAIVNTPTSVSGIPGNSVLQAVPNAQITVCSAIGGGIPCAPLVTIYSNVTLSIIAPNPFTADANGNYQFYVTPNAAGYICSVTGSGIVGQQCLIAPTTAGGGGGGSPALPGNSVQYNNGGIFGGAAGITTPDGNLLRIKGQDPWADISAFAPGALAGALNLTDEAVNVTCTNGLATVTLASASNFVNGGGVSLRNCGQTWNNAAGAQPTCNPPTVTPVNAAAPTRSHVTVGSAAGASTWNYKLVCRDRYGALTAPSTVGSTATGQASLGLQNATVTAASRSNDTITLTVTSNVTTNTMVSVGQTTPIAPQFTGDYQVCSNPGTTITFCVTPVDTRAMPSSNTDQTTWSGSSEIAWFQGNKLTWTHTTNSYEEYVCRSGPSDGGAYHVIGASDPSNPTTGFNTTSFEDWGATYMSGQVFPDYVTDPICTGTGQNDPLTTTITAGGGTTALTLANAANNSSSGTKIVHDDAPIVNAAALSISQATNPTFAGGTVFLPPINFTAQRGRNYVINSYLSLPPQIKILEAGGILLGEPMVLTGSTTWDCGWSQQGSAQFAVNGGCSVNVPVVGASIVVQGQGNVIRNLTGGATTNGYTLMLADNLDGELNVNLAGYTNNADTLGINLLIRDATQTINDVFLNTSSFGSGPNQIGDASWTPSVMSIGNGGNLANWIRMEKTNWTRRGFAVIGASNCSLFSSDWSYSQGPIQPLYTFYNCSANAGPYIFKDLADDTSGVARIFNMSGATPPNSTQGIFLIEHTIGGSSVPNPMVTGVRPSFIKLFGNSNDLNGNNDEPNRAMGGCDALYYFVLASPYELGGNAPANEAMCRFREPVTVGGGYAVGTELIPPSNLTSAAMTAGGGIPAGTYVWGIAAVDIRGQESMIPSPVTASQSTGGGNNTEPLTWTKAPGAATYNMYRAPVSGTCTSSGVVNGCGFYRVGSGITGNSFSDTSAATSGTAPSQMTAAMSNGSDSNGTWATSMLNVPTTFTGLGTCNAAAEGTVREITDSTVTAFAANITVGGGANHVLAHCNGTNWTVAGN